MQKVVVEGSNVTASQLKDLFRQIADGSIKGPHIQAFLEHRDPFGQSMELFDQLARWQALLDSMDIGCDISEVTIPKRQPGFDRLIVVPKELTMNKLVEIMRKRFGMWFYTDDLDKAIISNDRSNEKSAYAIWVCNNIEADEQYKSMSANQIAKQEIVGITVLERLLYELMYFDETRQHLDTKNVTLCTGSRDVDGGVPHVCYRLGYRMAYVRMCHPDISDWCVRTRKVIALPTQAS